MGQVVDYSAPYLAWPASVILRWPNTVATLVLFDREDWQVTEVRVTFRAGEDYPR